MNAESITIEAFRINASGCWELEVYKSVNEVLAIPVVDFVVLLRDIDEERYYRSFI